jgi:hypothetical protein
VTLHGNATVQTPYFSQSATLLYIRGKAGAACGLLVIHDSFHATVTVDKKSLYGNFTLFARI